MTNTSTQSGAIYKKIADAMKDIQPIGKNQQNIQQRFKFRGIDDVYNSLQPILAKHDLFSVTNVLTSKESIQESKTGTKLHYNDLTVEYRLYTTDGSYISGTVEGIGMDTGDKAANKAMAIAHKYFLTQLFMIPTSDIEDPDKESLELNDEFNGNSRYNGNTTTYVNSTPVSRPQESKIIDPPRPQQQQIPIDSAKFPAKPITEKQLNYLKGLLKKKNVDTDMFAMGYGFDKAINITIDKFNDILTEAKNA